MVSVVSVTPPDVVMRASAKRVFPLHLLAISTRVWSAVLSMSTRSASALAWSRVSNWDEAIDGRGVCIPLVPRRVEDGDVFESRRHATVTHRIALRRLAFAVIEGA